jgi:hypothetical protein
VFVWLNQPINLPIIAALDRFHSAMAGQHLTDNECLSSQQADLSEDEAERFEASVDVSVTRLGLETARRAALERVLRMRQSG